MGAFLAESLARDLPPSSRLLNPSDTKVTFGIQMPTNPAEACELIFLDSKNAPMLATLSIAAVADRMKSCGSTDPKEGGSDFTDFLSRGGLTPPIFRRYAGHDSVAVSMRAAQQLQVLR